MNILDIFQNGLQLSEETQNFLFELGFQLGLFLILAIVSFLVGHRTPALVKWVFQRVSPKQGLRIYKAVIEPIEHLFKMAGSLILIAACLQLLRDYEGLHGFLQLILDLSVIATVAWLVSRLLHQLIQVYGVALIKKLGLEVDEMLLVIETTANLVIGFIAVVAFAQSQDVNLIGLLAGVGIGGIAIAFAAQKTLEQLLGTVVLYLDRPFSPGDYIRVTLNPHVEPEYGRVESIGLRSTKLRTAAKSTLVVVPNSVLANIDIENITRGKKVMVLLYLDFHKPLEEREQALVEQVVNESTGDLYGIDPGSTKVVLFQPEDKPGTRARITFFILGSSENSIQLRKRLLELASESISSELKQYNIEFTSRDPAVYVDSPVTV